MQVRKLDKLLKKETLETLPENAYADGGGLYFIVRGGSRVWQFRYKLAGAKARKFTIAKLAQMSIGDARKQAGELYALVAQGKDPQGPCIEQVTVQAGTTSAGTPSEFRSFAHFLLSKRSFKSDVTRKAWIRSIDVICRPLHGKQLADIQTADVVKVLEPIWKTKSTVAGATQGRLHVILDAAAALSAKTGVSAEKRNPADIGLLVPILTRRAEDGTVRGGQAALDYQDMPRFWCELRAIDSVASKALQFLILTGVRSNEALQARFDQIKNTKYEPGAKCWAIPREVMKNGKAAEIPLSPTALAIIDEMRAGAPEGENLLFSSFEMNTELSDSTLLRLINRTLGYNGKDGADRATTHGMRATFRSWGQDGVDHDDQTLEFCLHHIKGGKEKTTYLRGHMWAKRKAALLDWEQYVTSLERERAQPAQLQEAA